MNSQTECQMDQATIELLEKVDTIEAHCGLDLETSARQTKALVRRREIHSAKDLLRLVLLYCTEDQSIRALGAWAVMLGIGFLSDVAILKRLRNCHEWLGTLFYECLRKRGVALNEQPGLRILLRDATVINGPGSKGTEWRLHFKFDLGRCLVSKVALTDAKGGETFERLPSEAGDIEIGDRGYGFASSIGSVLARLAHVLVRINWQNLPLWLNDGQKLDIIAWLRTLSGPSEQTIAVETPQGRFSLRLLAQPLPPDAAEEARRRAKRSSEKKKHTVREETLVAAGFLLLVTDLPAAAWPIERLLWLYRLRWQIELLFKMYKSLLCIDHLRSHDPKLVQTYLFGKLLIVFLLEQVAQQVRLRQPEWFIDPERPVSLWRLTAVSFKLLRNFIDGDVPIERFWSCLPNLDRYFRCSPRKRPQQLAWARALIEHLSSSTSFLTV